MNFSIIAAVDQNHGIGINNTLPWHLKADLKHFSDITIGNGHNAVIMGYNTWLSLPQSFRPLKDRLNIVLSKDKAENLPSEVLNYQSLEIALEDLETKNIDQAFVIGGAMLYDYAIAQPQCEKIYLTEIQQIFDCDAFFPALPSEFKKIEESETLEEKNIKFKFCLYQKI